MNEIDEENRIKCSRSSIGIADDTNEWHV